MSDYQTIRYQRDGDIGTLTLARPGKRNAQNPLMWEELARLGPIYGPDDTLRCLIVTGEGPTFSAGIDLAEGMAGMLAGMAGHPDDEGTRAAGRAAAGTFSWIPGLGCASIAAVRGHAYGAGLQLALACDFRIFAEGTKVGLLETRYGIMPDMGATVRLPRIIGGPGPGTDPARRHHRRRRGAANRAGQPGGHRCRPRRRRGRAGRAASRPAATGGPGGQAGHRRGVVPQPRGEPQRGP